MNNTAEMEMAHSNSFRAVKGRAEEGELQGGREEVEGEMLVPTVLVWRP